MLCRTASTGHIERSIRPTVTRAGFAATSVRAIAAARRVQTAGGMKKNPRTKSPAPSTTLPRVLDPRQLAAATGGDRGGVIIQRDGGVIVEADGGVIIE
jgi:hypothetical protein